MNDAIGAVTSVIPKFNDYLLRDYRKEQIDRIPDFMGMIFREAAKLFRGELKYCGYRTMTPKERLDYVKSDDFINGRIDIQQSEYSLMKFLFEFQGNQLEVPMYVPYLHENALIIGDTRFYMHLAIIERMIYHVQDGIIIKVMRSPLQFWRNRREMYESTDGEQFYDAVITVRAHYRRKASKNSTVTPLILYLLATYEFNEVMNILNVPGGAISFVDSVPVGRDPKTDKYIYFQCNSIYMKVDYEAVFGDKQYNLLRRVVASLICVLKMNKRVNLNTVYNTTHYEMILGFILYPNADNELIAIDHAKSHLSSLATYLDDYTKAGLAAMQIYCNNIYDLFVNVFIMIDEWCNWYSINDLFTKRIGGIDLLLIEVVKLIFNRFYDTQRKNKEIRLEAVKKMLKLPVNCIPRQCVKVQSIHSNNAMYNDNDLLCILIKKIRQSTAQSGGRGGTSINDKEYRFHPSNAVVECLLAISLTQPGASGDINPYLKIDTSGNPLAEKMPWYPEVLSLINYLVKV